MRYFVILFFGFFSSLSAATYLDTHGFTQDILTTSGDPHIYAGANLEPGVNITSIWLNFSVLDNADISGSRLIDFGTRDANLRNATIKYKLNPSTLSVLT